MNGPLSVFKRAVVIESEYLVMLEVERCLRLVGLEEVTSFADVRSAVKHCQGNRVDVAVIEGTTTGEAMVAAEAISSLSIPLLFCSGGSLPVVGFEQAPVVPKPFSERDFAAALMTAAGGSSSGGRD